MTVSDYLRRNTPDIKQLLCLTLNTSTSWLYAHPQYTLTDTQIKQLQQYIQQRNKDVPLAYLSGSIGFYHLDFKVTADTLVPRSETEQIIDIVRSLNLDNANILDLGTGTGIIAITLKSLYPHFKVTASDISLNALKVAKHNASIHNTNITFIHSNWFENITIQHFDIIISNPPYIDPNSTYVYPLRHEPKEALLSSNNGMQSITHIISNALPYLSTEGYLLLEHGFDQREYILPLLVGYSEVKVYDDLSGIPRNILAKK